MSVQDDLENILDGILSLNSMKNVKDIIWKYYLKKKSKPSQRDASKLKILILNSPCHGFGDIIFAMKFGTYLKDWYKAKVTIATSSVDGLLKLGWNKQDAVVLSTGKNREQCRRFKFLKIPKLSRHDLIFLAPVQSDLYPDLHDVKKLIPYSNRLNTFTLSEYNDSLEKNFDFNTGVGKNRDGMFFTNTAKIKGKVKGVKGKYTVAYISDVDENESGYHCLSSFLELIAVKYKNKKEMQIMIPEWIARESEDFLSSCEKKLKKHMSSLKIIYKEEGIIKTEILFQTDKSLIRIVLKTDIFPLPYDDMIRLFKNSEADVLVTGDQSITDVLSCCYKKNIFYQTLNWKIGFAKNLSRYMPNKYLKSKKTACGTLKAVDQKSNYEKFIREWDFQKLARPKMDAIVLFAVNRKKHQDLEDLATLILSSKNLATVKKRARDF